MSEKKHSLVVPEAFLPLLEDVRLLKSDGQNPNKMTNKQHEELWRSLVEFGWTDPIKTDKAGIFCDGEQRAIVCKAHNEFFVPVLRLSMTEVQRRQGRQRFNKLRGKHSKLLDQAEWKRIIDLGEKASLEVLLEAVGEKLPEDLSGLREGSNIIPETREIVIRGFRGKQFDEQAQKTAWEKFIAEGYDAGLLNL